MPGGHELAFSPDDAQLFVIVAEAGSFTAAAARQQLTPSAVSKAIGRLERALGVRLVARTTRALHLTEEGVRFQAVAKRALDLFSEAYEEAAASTREIRGVVRIGLPPLFGTFVLPEMLRALRARHPALRIELISTMRISDLIERGLDLMIAVGELADSSFAARPLGWGDVVTVAAPAYLARAGTPTTPAALSAHTCLAYLGPDGRAVPWQFLDSHGIQPLAVDAALASDDLHHLAALAVAGLGIAQLPRLAVATDLTAHRLVPLLAAHDPPPRRASLVYPAGRVLPHRVRAVLDHLTTDAAPVPGTSHRPRRR